MVQSISYCIYLISAGTLASVTPTLLATDDQYTASAALVVWLCKQLGLPLDRNHIRTHNEASPRDGHVLCCTGALDPDKVVTIAKTL